MDAQLELIRSMAVTMGAGLALFSLLFWQVWARGCGACGARRSDMHSPDCPFKDGES